MLIEFRVENHRSLRDEQALTLEASRIGEPSDLRPRSIAGHAERLLPAAVIYGANASGKSNVLAALAFMREAVILSHRRWEPDGGIPRTAFAWGGKRKEPSMFEVTLLIGETKYEYGFSVGDETVEEEWLSAWPNNREQVWFEREGREFSFGEHLRGPNAAVREVTRPNALFLSAAAQHGHEQLMSLFSWFRRIFPVNVTGRNFVMAHAALMPEMFFLADDEERSVLPKDDTTDSLARRIRNLLKAADIGIIEVKRIDGERELRGRKIRQQRILLQHQAGDDDSWLDLDEESAGTKTLFRMAPSIFGALDSGGLLLVDELESSLHPLLGLTIVRLFNSPKTNPKNAQILFTTHDTNLMGTTLGEPLLRRDQIWFTEKDKDGASQVYPLTNYKPRKSEESGDAVTCREDTGRYRSWGN